jgi:hypothetical protein
LYILIFTFLANRREYKRFWLNGPRHPLYLCIKHMGFSILWSLTN